MVFKLPSARCLSKASRDGALSENMANADINASLKGISTSSTRSSAMVAKCSRSKRKSASAQRYLRPFGTTMDIATLNLTSSTCDIVPMRAVLWHSCLRKARWDTGVVTKIYRPPGIAVPGRYLPDLCQWWTVDDGGWRAVLAGRVVWGSLRPDPPRPGHSPGPYVRDKDRPGLEDGQAGEGQGRALRPVGL